MVKIPHSGCPGLSQTISAQFTFEMCAAAQNREKKSVNTSISGAQGRSRSLILMSIERAYGTSC